MSFVFALNNLHNFPSILTQRKCTSDSYSQQRCLRNIDMRSSTIRILLRIYQVLCTQFNSDNGITNALGNACDTIRFSNALFENLTTK